MAEATSLSALARRAAGAFWNRREHRLRALWRIAGLTGCQFLLMLGLVFVLRNALGPVGHGLASLALWRGVSAAVTLASLCLGVWVLDRRSLPDVGLRLDREWWLDCAFGFALGGLLMSGIFAAERALGWVELRGAFQSTDPSRTFAAALLTPLALFVCVGIDEELVFRGYLLRNLADGFVGPRLSPRTALLTAALVSSCMFGLVHARNPGATPASTASIAVAGLLLSLGYLLTGRLGLPIGLHVAWNLFQGNVYGFAVSGLRGLDATLIAVRQLGPPVWTGGDFGPEAGLLGQLAMLAGCVLIAAWTRLRTGRLAVVERLVEPPRSVVPSPEAPPTAAAAVPEPSKSL